MVCSLDTNLKAQVKAVLVAHQGRTTAIKAGELAELLSSTDRAVRLAIRALIAEGLPVASATETPAGYFITETLAEREAYMADLKGRLIQDALRRRDYKLAAARAFEGVKQGKLI